MTWSKSARSDLAAIRRRQKNKDRAKRLGARLFGIAVYLEEHPELGRAGEIAGTRELVVSGTPYILVYEISDDGSEVSVLNVVDGRSDWK